MPLYQSPLPYLAHNTLLAIPYTLWELVNFPALSLGSPPQPANPSTPLATRKHEHLPPRICTQSLPRHLIDGRRRRWEYGRFWVRVRGARGICIWEREGWVQ
ncbi:hypothetical protein HYDPIDRAFT_118573 [Hydnomerulius pinastri MD-312]|uniref:Uncharacterized protein n=1 Tax=Hydnomerulius pinastri MD-312 TaxID=994086 RepID=A0A0C9W947_9AGAM|nr:hypothetical protein HYDPIDRAFT_118573 [Hydnomerulius pinastri MD-312]